MNTSIMSTKQWYTSLLEDTVLMHQPIIVLLPVRAETLIPNSNWTRTWQLVRTKGLGSDRTSFLFKLVNGLLPTQDRVARLGLADGD